MDYLEIESPNLCHILTLFAALLLAGCGGGDEAQPPSALVDTRADPNVLRVAVLKNSFDNAACMNWQTYAARDGSFFLAEIKPLDLLSEPDGNGYAVSKSPWWIDPNHGPPGAGFLNLVAVAYYDGWVGTDAEVRALASGKPMDLRDATVVVRWRAPTLAIAPDSKLVFWFQTRALDPSTASRRYVNYALTGQPLALKSGDTNWQETELELRADPEKWTCLGSSDSRADFYGCADSIDEALASFETDLGFVILSPDEGSAMSSSGEVEFDSISMLIPPWNRKTHARTARYLDTESSLCLM